MVKKQPDNSPKPQTQRPIEIPVYLDAREKEYVEDFISLVTKLELANGAKVLQSNSISEFTKTCVTFFTNFYMNTFTDSRVIDSFKDKQSKKDFIAFRTKYMNFPVDAQLNDLKRLGLVNAKTQE